MSSVDTGPQELLTWLAEETEKILHREACLLPSPEHKSAGRAGLDCLGLGLVSGVYLPAFVSQNLCSDSSS